MNEDIHNIRYASTVACGKQDRSLAAMIACSQQYLQEQARLRSQKHLASCYCIVETVICDALPVEENRFKFQNLREARSAILLSNSDGKLPDHSVAVLKCAAP